MRVSALVGVVLAILPMPAAAIITNVDFRGTGRVTASRVGPEPEFPPPTPPAVGTRVTVTGSLLIDSDSALPDDFTGVFQFDESALFDGEQAFQWQIAGGQAFGETSSFAYAGGSASFVSGRLTSLNLFVDYDGLIEELGPTTWQSIYTRQDTDWGGTWTLAVPEPSSWAMMIAGFGLAGLGLRARRSQRPAIAQ